jgi:hypothetical protein
MAKTHSLHLKRKMHRKGKKIKFDNFKEVLAEGGAGATQGMLLDYVVPACGPPKLVPLHKKPTETVRKIKAIPGFTPEDEGRHSVFLVIFDKGDDGNYRFLTHHTDEIHVIE